MYIHERHWNERQRRVCKSHRHHREINTLVSEKLADAEGAVLERQREGKLLRPRHIKHALTDRGPTDDPSGDDFLRYADDVAQRLHRNGQIATARRYQALIKKLRICLTGDPPSELTLPFEDVTPQLLRRFETYEIEERENARTTVAKDLGIIRAIFYRAIRDGLVQQGENPFFHFQIRQGTPDRDTLSQDQLRKIEDSRWKKEADSGMLARTSSLPCTRRECASRTWP